MEGVTDIGENVEMSSDIDMEKTGEVLEEAVKENVEMEQDEEMGSEKNAVEEVDNTDFIIHCVNSLDDIICLCYILILIFFMIFCYFHGYVSITDSFSSDIDMEKTGEVLEEAVKENVEMEQDEEMGSEKNAVEEVDNTEKKAEGVSDADVSMEIFPQVDPLDPCQRLSLLLIYYLHWYP
jgi:hypothetical protein